MVTMRGNMSGKVSLWVILTWLLKWTKFSVTIALFHPHLCKSEPSSQTLNGGKLVKLMCKPQAQTQMKLTNQMWFHKPLRKSPAFRLLTCRLSLLMSIHMCLVSVLQSTDILNGTLDALLATGALPAYPWPVQTLESAKHCLGIDADQYITQYVICLQCWKHYTSKQVSEFDSPAYLVGDCEGILFDEVKATKNDNQRKLIHTPQSSTLYSIYLCDLDLPKWPKIVKGMKAATIMTRTLLCMISMMEPGGTSVTQTLFMKSVIWDQFVMLLVVGGNLRSWRAIIMVFKLLWTLIGECSIPIW